MSYVMWFQQIDQTMGALVGGKAAHLGELSRIDGIRVPDGFCVTTDAFRRFRTAAPSLEDRLARLSRLPPGDRDAIRTLGAEIRQVLEDTAIPEPIATAITDALPRLGEHTAYAVRSSATAEDLPTASFAGQQDTYLNVIGPASILAHVRRCWASLFTERAIAYRMHDGFDHQQIDMAVIVQQMVFPLAAGVLFTADPVTSNRKVASVEASFGLGEALVSGRVNADLYKVREGAIIARTIGTKQRAIVPRPGGGTQEQPIAPDHQMRPALSDAQVLRIVQLGRQIEAHFGRPQDIEWCLDDGRGTPAGSAAEWQRGSDDGRGTPAGSAAEWQRGSDDGRGTPAGSAAEWQRGSDDGRGTPAGSAAEWQRGSDDGRGTPAGSAAEWQRGSDDGRGTPAGSAAEWQRGSIDDDVQIVQSRPITTLFPIPVTGDGENHVFISVGHQQMMTDAMKPLGISLFQITAPRPMYEAGGRLFVDVSPELASPARRDGLVSTFGKTDPLVGAALQAIVDRGDVIRTIADEAPRPMPAAAPAPIETDPDIVARLVERSQASLAALKRDIQGTSGSARLDVIRADLHERRRIVFDPQSLQAIMAGMEATWWLNDQLQAWLGEKHAADTLVQSVPHNVTSEMGLALLDVADVIRPHPEVVAFLQRAIDGRGTPAGSAAEWQRGSIDGRGTPAGSAAEWQRGSIDDDFLDALPALPGGREAREAITGFLATYGMRGVGEIDITRPRWSERPSALLPILLGNLKNFEAGAARRRFEQGQRAARAKEQDLLVRVRALPDGERKAEQVQRMIDRLRTFVGYREYPKYGLMGRYFVYKQALLAEAEYLVTAAVIRHEEDIFYLTFDELADAVRTQRVDDQLIGQREAAFRSYRALVPPRVFTSDGEVMTGTYRRDGLPAGALVGLPVSAGIIEGRARVILDLAEAHLDAGDILVTAYTDPSWTPAFVAIQGLVTEVGGLMTHGAVIAREYGLPAVVGVERATERIRDGQRIRVHGTDGYVELLD